MAKAAPVIRDISVLSQELFDDIIKTEGFSSHYEKKGLFMLCQTEKVLEAEVKTANLANELGLEAREVNAEEIKQLEPNIEIDAIGAAYFECDHHSTPNEFMISLKQHLKNTGVTFYTNEKVKDLILNGQKIKSIITDKRELSADEFVLAAGSWTGVLSKKLGLNLLMQAGKGYRINTAKETGVTIPAILCEAKAAVTPMNGFTRFAGTMEIAGINHNINRVRVDAIANAIKRYYPSINITEEEKELRKIAVCRDPVGAGCHRRA